jgi:hypothetical protein
MDENFHVMQRKTVVTCVELEIIEAVLGCQKINPLAPEFYF